MDKIQVWLKDNGYDEKEYQLKGIEWCRERELVGNMAGEKRVYGGLLADEMGLGKTVTMLAQIVGNELSRTLIVVPKILLQQWKRTIEANTNKKVWLFHGEEAKISEEKLKRYDIVLTTYGMVSLVSGRRANIIYKIKWDRAIFDEAHHLKNSKTAVFKGVCEIKRDITWLVTGTPIQNRKTDFYSLCYCMGLPSSYYTNEDNLMDLVEKFMLKRTKAEVGIILPDLTIKNETVAWGSEEEKSLAENFHGVLKFTSATINKDFSPEIQEQCSSTLQAMMRARQMCILPEMIPISMNGKENMQDKVNKVVADILTSDSDIKKIVFCHFHREIEVIRDKLKEEGKIVEIIEGSTSYKERTRILDDKPEVLILQINTGCEGLNLQEYSEIYFVSPHWNPAVEDQAIARCHRLGQTKPVNIYRYKMENLDDTDTSITLDTYASQVQEKKRELMKCIDK